MSVGDFIGLLVTGPFEVGILVREMGEDNWYRVGTAEPSHSIFPKDENQN